MTDPRPVPPSPKRGSQAVLAGGQSAFAKYRTMTAGDLPLTRFLYFEIVTFLFGRMSGALGFALRAVFYPRLFASCGRRVIFCRDLVLRHPQRIHIGSGVVLGDGVTLDAKGSEGEGIVIRDGVFLGVGTIVTMTDGTIVLDACCNIGSYCRIGTHGRTRIGRKALLAAYCYVVGASHETVRVDVPILDQPVVTKGGAEVGDGCWLGARVTVMDGCTVGPDSIVGAHAVVTHDLPARCVAVGIPARVQRMRE